LASRAAVLTTLAAFGAASLQAGCLRTKSTTTGGAGCTACHAVHYAAEGSCGDCHRGRATATRKELAHERLIRGRVAQFRLPAAAAPREGERLVDALACRRCHTIGGRGNRLATELDRVVWQREQDALAASIAEPVEGMPPFGLDAARAQSIVAFLLRGADPRATQESYRVHFERRASAPAGAFERLCGPCHRALTPAGLLGSGAAGPNLSGLFTPFYPRTARQDTAWTRQALVDWLRNPRAIRPGTTMPPVVLNEADLRQLLGELGGAGP
jgi:cytochrome c2